MGFLTDLLVRVIIIVTVTDSITFYLMARRHETHVGKYVVVCTPTLLFSILVIAVTLVPLIINIVFVFYRYGAWGM
jgi:hypothetical protein